MLRDSPFVGLKARRVKQKLTLIYLLFQGWVRVLAVVFVESSGGKGVLSMFYKSLDGSLKLQQEM